MIRKIQFMSVLFAGLMLASTCPAQTTGVNVTGTTGLFFTDSAETLDPGYLNVGAYGSYIHNEVDDDFDFEDVYEINAILGIGITRRLELAASLPYIWYDGDKDHDGISDLTISAKYGFLQESEGDAFGLALKPFVTIPTGEGGDGLGRDNDRLEPGIAGIISKRLGNFDVNLNVGGVFRAHEDIDIRSTGDDDDYVFGGIGIGYNVNENWLVFTEFRADSRDIGGDFPADGTLGVRYVMNDRLAITAGGTLGFDSDSTPDWRAGVGVTYAFGPLWGVSEPKPRPPAPTPTPAPPKPTKAPTAAPTAPPPTPEIPEELPVFKMLYFDYDKSNLLPESVKELTTVTQILKDNPNYGLRIEGHACIIGSHEYNQRLSERRANAAKTYLVSQGIAESRLEAIGYGETRPAVPQKEGVREPRNRRVEMIVIRLVDLSK